MPGRTKVHLIRPDENSAYCGNKVKGPRSTKQPTLATCRECLFQYYRKSHAKELDHPILRVLARNFELQMGRPPIDFFEIVDLLTSDENLRLLVSYIEEKKRGE